MRHKNIILIIFFAAALVGLGCRGQGSSGIATTESTGDGFGNKDQAGDKREDLLLDACQYEPEDTDDDGVCDAMDTDDDGDGVPDIADTFPKDPARSAEEPEVYIPPVTNRFVVSKIKKMIGSELKDWVVVEYNGGGFMESITEYAYSGATRYVKKKSEFIYVSGRLATETNFDSGTLTSDPTAASSYRYEYSGNRIMVHTDGSDAVTTMLVEENKRTIDVGNDSATVRTVVTMNSAGNPMSVAMSALVGGSTANLCTMNYNYDSGGKPSSFSGTGSGCARFGPLPNLTWRVTDRENEYDILHDGSDIGDQEYDENGLVIQEEIGSSARVYYSYDDHGNLEEIITYASILFNIEYEEVPVDPMNLPTSIVSKKMLLYMTGLASSPFMRLGITSGL